MPAARDSTSRGGAPPTRDAAPRTRSPAAGTGSGTGSGDALSTTRSWPWVLLVLSALVAMWPVWTSPVQADDRYWYLISTGDFDGSPAAAVANVVPDADPASGRVTPLAFLVRRLTSMALLEAAQVTAVPLGVWHGLLKVTTFAVAVAVSYGLVASLRWRSPAGLVPLSRGTRLFVGAGLVAAVAAGAQTQAPARNAWVAYPVLTVGAVAVVLGVMGLLVVLTRFVARGGALRAAVSVGVGALLAVVLNTTYELYYVAVPAAALLVVLLPATADGCPRVELRAKVLALAPFLVAFTALFLALRAGIAAACAEPAGGEAGQGEDEPCYVGTQPALGTGLLVTAVRNLAGSVPGAGRTELLADLAAVAGGGAAPPPVTTTSLVLAAALVTGLLGVLLSRDVTDDLSGTTEPALAATRSGAGGPGEAGVLVRTASVLLLVGVGGAVLMALSGQAQEVIVGIGQPYRHTVLTWVAIALSAVMLARSLVLVRPATSRGVAVALAASVAALVAVGWPLNTAATWAARQLPGAVAVTAVHDEVLRADGEAGDARRCEAVVVLQRDLEAGSVRRPLLRGADDVYRLYHDAPFCSAGYGRDGPGSG